MYEKDFREVFKINLLSKQNFSKNWLIENNQIKIKLGSLIVPKGFYNMVLTTPLKNGSSNCYV